MIKIKYTKKGNYSIFLLVLLMTEFINTFLRAKSFIPLEISVGYRRLVFVFFLVNLIWIWIKKFTTKNKLIVKDVKLYLWMFSFAGYIILIYFFKNAAYDLTELLNLVSWWIVPVLFFHYGIPRNKKLFSILLVWYVIVYFALYLTYVINSKVFIWNNSELVNSVYFMLVTIPLLAFVNKRTYRMWIWTMIVVVTILSSKTTAMIIVIVSLLYYWIHMGNTSKHLKRIGIVLCLLTLCVPILAVVENLFGVNIADTLTSILNDGGNGRMDIWLQVIDHFKNGTVLEKMFGFGFGTSSRLFRLSAHNDFLEVVLDFGVVGLVLMMVSIITLWRSAYRRLQGEKMRVALMLILIQIILLFLFSNALFTSKYILILFATYALIMSAANSPAERGATV